MSQINLTISDQKGRLDKVLAERFPDYSRTFFTSRIESKKATVNGDTVDPKYKVKSGDQISVDTTTETVETLIPQNIPLDIVYEDDDLIIVNKPQGMVVHPSNGHSKDTLVNALLFYSPLSSINGEFRPGIVHRIDKDTSGLLMVAKNDKAHNFLAAELKTHKTGRHYLAIVHGKFKEEKGTIDAPIGRDKNNRQKQAIEADGRDAVTHFEVLEQFEGYSLVRLTLETGRTHQIRVHMAYIGHPVAGDPLYGPKKTLKGEGQFLHASTLEIEHPTTGQVMAFEAPLPSYFEESLAKLRRG
ncbi:MAG: RluA family pseudouridine synthase [Lactobacillaceae bacterium]|jgi:23S rRNA pseudouridine1911/1915/1917 synthase|nr:RluA family pseudouridine synthase [Lactobacillaceae bacterium]